MPPPVGGSAPVAPLASVVPGAPRVRALADKEVFGFLPYWELGEAAQSVDLDKLTTLAWFGVEAGPKGRLIRKSSDGTVPLGYRGWTDPAWKALMAKAQAKGVRVVLTVQRFSWDAGARAKTIKLLQQPQGTHPPGQRHRGRAGRHRSRWRQPRLRADARGGPRRLHAASCGSCAACWMSRGPDAQITFDITASVDQYDIAALTADDAADAVFLMAYDYIGNSAATRGVPSARWTSP